MVGAMAAAPQPFAKVEPARVWRDAPVAVDRCKGGDVVAATDKVAPPQPLKLGELPKANSELTVNRKIGRCQAPAIVSYGVGK